MGSCFKTFYLLIVGEGARVYPREPLEVQALLAVDPFPIVCLRVPGVIEPTLLPPRWDLHGQFLLLFPNAV